MDAPDMGDDLDRIDQEIRINELEESVRELGGDMHFSPDCPPDLHEQSLRSVLDWEHTPDTTHLEQLARRGYIPPSPGQLDDAQVHEHLWALIRQLAEIRVFLYCTNHLSDRELYTWLVDDSLRECVKDFPADESSAWHLDVLGGCSEEDLHLSLMYYDDEETRQHWHADFPEDEIPPHEDPPYDRDRLLPQCGW